MVTIAMLLTTNPGATASAARRTSGWRRGMSFDEWLTVSGLILGAIAAVGAVVAATYAIRANLATRAGATDEQRRWRTAITPRPKIQIEPPPTSAEAPDLVKLTISNPGAAITQGFVLVRVGRAYYGTGFNLAEHTGPLTLSGMPKVGDALSHDTRQGVMVVVAQDVDGNWWDCGEETIISEFPTGGVAGAKFTEWLNARLLAVHHREAE